MANDYQVWLKCNKKDVKRLKSSLEQWNQLSKNEKIQPSTEDGVMIIPTTILSNNSSVEHSLKQEILAKFCTGSLASTGEVAVILLPLSSNLDISSQKTGVVHDAVGGWLAALPAELFDTIKSSIQDLMNYCPRRWSVYRPMLLLPTGSFLSPSWKQLLQQVRQEELNNLWTRILVAVSKADGGGSLTHLALNSGIPPEIDTSDDENILRSPSRLTMLYGDFGPEIEAVNVTEKAFEDAFWVSTRQNGIYQTWAPRYTMFSRGNIKEKARILGFHDTDTALTATRKAASTLITESTVVDMYAGIGYFTFSYAKMGFCQVLCWEINPWSVEGLRRGALENGWKIRVVKGEDLNKPMSEIVDDAARIVVFQESNAEAGVRIIKLRERDTAARVSEIRDSCDVMHVNCGLLPHSNLSWEIALEVLGSKGGWLHLHENVRSEDLEARKDTIQKIFTHWVGRERPLWIAKVEHVELVKTFAPGIWHTVFDVYIAPGP